MLACVDVAYAPDDSFAVAAGLLFHRWDDAAAADERTARLDEVAPYEPGAFYRRELPPLLGLLRAIDPLPEVVVVDGYVWLSADGRPGLGARLFEALGGRVVVVGVAKTAFHGDAPSVAVKRGKSEKPLHVTAAGATPDEAAAWIRSMHGPHRLPTLLARVDRLCRDALTR
ncbi:endonuclease V [Polyangium sorediatum]|uniref:Endonuclease V n=1 Tax=Polyangium sorediatum TaxID=889274 RepID=A0ABT6P806_9BACT|nr:endonuclease V [Polyangium sorediatum]MDI1436732.1 endonuclease V [Polyangium sorediatum]